jgi:hypothetical protein
VSPDARRLGCTGVYDASRLGRRPIEKAKSGLCQEPNCPQLYGVLNFEMRFWDSPAEIFIDFMAVTTLNLQRNVWWEQEIAVGAAHSLLAAAF